MNQELLNMIENIKSDEYFIINRDKPPNRGSPSSLSLKNTIREKPGSPKKDSNIDYEKIEKELMKSGDYFLVYRENNDSLDNNLMKRN